MAGLAERIIEVIPAGVAVVTLAFVLWLVIRGYLASGQHLTSEIKARQREESRHEDTREELRKNTEQLERLADAISDTNKGLQVMGEIRRTLQRIESKLEQ